MITALSFITNKLFSLIDGLEIFSLSIFKVEIVLPDLISMTNNLPLFVDKYILLTPMINPVGLIFFLFLGLIFFKISVTLIMFPDFFLLQLNNLLKL